MLLGGCIASGQCTLPVRVPEKSGHCMAVGSACLATAARRMDIRLCEDPSRLLCFVLGWIPIGRRIGPINLAFSGPSSVHGPRFMPVASPYATAPRRDRGDVRRHTRIDDETLEESEHETPRRRAPGCRRDRLVREPTERRSCPT
jgi:hypothetical protein